MRIRDTTADGINFHGGVTNSTVTGSDIRNTGDDGIATWADSGIGADANDTISNNTVQLQMLANGIAIYGGHDNTVTGNLVQDTGITQGGGIQVGQRFSSTPVGTTTISNNTMIRDGDLDPNWQFGVGALWFDGSQGSITGPINVTNALIEQSPYEAIQWVEGSISGVNLNNVTIAGTGTFALQEQTPGSASATNVVATGVAQANAGKAPSYSCEGSGFTITDGGGNSGITPTQCNGWPAPVYPPYPNSGVTVAPTALSFGSVTTGTTSSAQTVTVSNPTGSAAPVSSISASGDFAQTNTCGSSIPANGSCTVSVTFTPTATGARTGTLTVNAGGTANTVSLSGTGTSGGGGGSATLTASPTSLSFGNEAVGSTSGSKSVTVTNTGSAAASVSSVSAGAPFAQTNTCGSSIAAGASCTVSVTFTPTTTGAASASLTVASNATNPSLTVPLTGTGTTSGGNTNLALNAPITASSYTQNYVPANADDGNTSTYWEGTNGVWPTTLTVNLGASDSLSSVVVALPPSSSWSTRTQTFSVLGSGNGSSYSTLVGSATYTFNPSTGNTVTIPLPSGTSDQYVQLSFTANSVQNGAQVSELQVFGP
jgi:parallel beta-helix repeat protein